MGDVAMRESESAPLSQSVALDDAGTCAESHSGRSVDALVTASGFPATFGNSAAMSQMRVLAEDSEAFVAEMPEGAVDVNGQQIDLREKHSWKLRLHEVSTEELVECLCVNTITPFTLNAKMKE